VIESAAQFAELWDRERPGGWLGSDGTWTIRHPTWRATLFANGDTALATADGVRSMPRHTFVVYDDDAKRLRLVLTDDILVPPGKGEWYWGGEMVWDGPDLWMFAARIGPTESGWGFDQVGRDLIHACWPVHGKPHFEINGYYDTTSVWGDVDWGAGLCRTPLWTYVFGVYREPDWGSRWIFGHRVYAARARPGDLDSRWLWEYLTVDGWRRLTGSVGHGLLKPIIDEAEGPANVFSVDIVDGVWKIVSKKHGDFGSEVTVWETRSLSQPWVTRRLFDAPWSAHDNTYGVRAHTDLPRTEEGLTLVSVNHNRTGAPLGDFFQEPFFYRPSWHEYLL
jgi:hypothetical protein